MYRKASLQQFGAGQTGYPHAKECDWTHISPYTKINSKWIKTAAHKTSNFETGKGSRSIGRDFLKRIPKCAEKNPKTWQRFSPAWRGFFKNRGKHLCQLSVKQQIENENNKMLQCHHGPPTPQSNLWVGEELYTELIQHPWQIHPEITDWNCFVIPSHQSQTSNQRGNKWLQMPMVGST